MHRLRRDCLISGLLLWVVVGSSSSEAQFSANFQTNLISGVSSNWTGSYIVGSNTSADALLIQGTGVLVDTFGYLGYEAGSSNNSVRVIIPGSIWSNASTLYVGASDSGNSLVISNGGRVFNGLCYAGYKATSTSNSVAVTGFGSVWSNWNYVYIGYSGTVNRLTINNFGKVISYGGFVGQAPGGSNNSVLVTGQGSVWSNDTLLAIGYFGGNNTMVVSNRAQVFSPSTCVGCQSTSSNNNLVVTGIDTVWNGAISVGCYFGSVVVSGGARVTGDGGIGGVADVALVTDPGSVWNGNFTITGGNNLVISNGGAVVNNTADAYLGLDSFTVGNTVLVTGTGSLWSNVFTLSIGFDGASNRLVISNGGQVLNATDGYLGYWSIATNNSVLVTGSGSVWTNTGSLYVGYFGRGGRLVITDGGRVFNSDATVGYWIQSSNNSVRVVNGAVWQSGSVCIGNRGSSNSLLVAGGSVIATSLAVGLASSGCNNLLQLDSGIIIVTNATHDATLEVRNGVLIVNGGVLQADRLVMTNGCAQFIRSGGTLIVSNVVLDPNQSAVGDGIPNGWKQQYNLDPLDPTVAGTDPDGDGFSNLQEFLAGTDPTNSASYFHITSAVSIGNDIRVIWMTGLNKTNALQATAAGNYATNNFADIFTVTNAVGSTTNYLDLGGATNIPARYYRVRLVP